MPTNGHSIEYDKIITEEQANVNCMTWKIMNAIEFLNENNTQEFRTKMNRDTIKKLSEPNFQLKIKFVGHKNDIMELYYLSTQTVFLKVYLCVIKKNQQKRNLKKTKYKSVDANKWIYICSLKKTDLDYDAYNYLEANGNLTMIFTFKTAINVTVDGTYVPKASLSNDLEDLLIDGLFADVTIKSADGVNYKVHKALISSRSSVLKAHFIHNTTESNTNIVESPFNAEILYEVLSFIYTDRVPKIEEIPEKIIAAADYYMLNHLKFLCEESLHRKLTSDNAIETLLLADCHSANHLKDLILKFIKNGEEKLITGSKEWNNLESAKLIKEIYEYVILNDSKHDIEFV